MSQAVRRLRLAIARVCRQKNGRRRRYPTTLRQSVVDHARAEVNRGVSVRATAASLGLPYPTLVGWMPSGGAGRFRTVTVGAKADDPALRLVTPQGCRIEGLRREDIAYLLRALS